MNLHRGREAGPFTVNQQLGGERPQTLELLDRIEVATGWVGPVLCIDVLYPTPGGFVNFRDFDKALEGMKFRGGSLAGMEITDAGERMSVPEFMAPHETR